jgi:hypothetical protein
MAAAAGSEYFSESSLMIEWAKGDKNAHSASSAEKEIQ